MIAIAITILVLGLEVPSVHEVPESKLSDFLLASVHSVLGYILSFLLIGMYWIQHYTIFHALSRADRPFLLLNLVFLLCLSFLPFPTGLYAVYRDDELSVFVYAVAQSACAFSLLVLWFYATWNHRLISPDFSTRNVTSVTRRLTITPVLCAVAIAVSFMTPWLARLVFLAIPFLFISHYLLDPASQQIQADTSD